MGAFHFTLNDWSVAMVSKCSHGDRVTHIQEELRGRQYCSNIASTDRTMVPAVAEDKEHVFCDLLDLENTSLCVRGEPSLFN